MLKAVPSNNDELSASRKTWDALAMRGRECAGGDPKDRRGLKNFFMECMHQQTIDEELNFSGHESILDLGCGTGLLEEFLVTRARSCVGVDISAEMLKHAAQAGIPGANFCRYDGSTLPFATGAFDAIITKGVLNLVSDKLLVGILKECRRTIKPNGTMLSIELSSSHPGRQNGRVDGRFTRATPAWLSLFEAGGFDLKHFYPLRKGRSLVQYLVRYGFYPKHRIPELARKEREKLRQRTDINSRYYVQYAYVFGPARSP